MQNDNIINIYLAFSHSCHSEGISVQVDRVHTDIKQKMSDYCKSVFVQFEIDRMIFFARSRCFKIGLSILGCVTRIRDKHVSIAFNLLPQSLHSSFPTIDPR